MTTTPDTQPLPPAPSAPVLGGPVLVTGGASGLGAAVARAVGRTGTGVAVLDRRESPDGVPGVVVDLSDGRAAEAAVRRAAEGLGGLWAVVTCAGVDVPGRLEDVAADDWERVVK